jgi:hypothetical protein
MHLVNKYKYNFEAAYSDAHPVSYTMGTGGSLAGAKGPGRVADHSPPISADTKKTWIYTSIPPYAFMA